MIESFLTLHQIEPLYCHCPMPSSGRFRSQVFNFLSQQTLRLRDRTQELLRRARITASWAAQITLYPIYLAFQATRLAGNRLSQALPRVFPWLPQGRATGLAQTRSSRTSLPTPAAVPDSDTPIQNTLTFAHALLQSTPLPHALATHLATHHLVLVAEQNQILDLFTQEQQSRLQQQITYELASYWRDRRLLQAPQQPALLPPNTNHDKNVLPPIRVFLRLMNWMQRGQVAIAVNLFQEAALAIYFPDVDVLLESAVEEDIWWISDRSDKPQSDFPLENIQYNHPGNSVWHHPDFPNPQPQRLKPTPSHQLLPAGKRGGAVQPASPTGRMQSQASPTPPDLSPHASTTAQPAYPPSRDVPAEHLSLHPDPYIDTQSTLVGYVKHPLAQLLEWLDTGMLWLENRCARLWRWLQQPWKR